MSDEYSNLPPGTFDGDPRAPWNEGDGVGASKYVWRMWSKADPKNDCAKARDCLARLEKRMGWSE